MVTITTPAPIVEDYPVVPAKRSEVIRDDIIDAFKRTDLKPVTGTWGDGRGDACAITAMAIAKIGKHHYGSVLSAITTADLGLSREEINVILSAWDHGDNLFGTQYEDLAEGVFAARRAVLGY